METLVAVLLYIGALNPGCQCYTADEVQQIADQNSNEVEMVYSNEEKLMEAELDYSDDVYTTLKPIGIWIPDDGEIAY